MLRRALTAIALLALTTGASAQEFDRTGAYIGVGGVIGIEDFNVDQVPNSLGIEKFDPNRSQLDMGDTGMGGVDFRAGYRFHANVAGELNYFWVDSYNVNFQGSKAGSIDLQGLTANVKAYPLTGQFQPYLLGGVGLARGEFEGNSSTDLTWKAAAGIDLYPFTDAPKAHWALYFEGSYLLPQGDVEDLNLWSCTMGVKYRF